MDQVLPNIESRAGIGKQIAFNMNGGFCCIRKSEYIVRRSFTGDVVSKE